MGKWRKGMFFKISLQLNLFFSTLFLEIEVVSVKSAENAVKKKSSMQFKGDRLQIIVASEHILIS